MLAESTMPLSTSRPSSNRASARASLPLPLAWVPSAAALIWTMWAAPAAAQVTSWLYVGGGGGVLEAGEREEYPLVQLDTGLGSTADVPIVVGAIARVQGYVGGGADLGALARVVSRGYAKGDFGLGVDLGVNQRLWGEKTTQLAGNLVLGAPWGVTCIAGAALGAEERRGFFVSLGVDFARLTVHRHTGLDWFPNPMRSPGD